MKEQINAITKHQERLKDVIEHLEAEKYDIQSYRENCRLYKAEINKLERDVDRLNNIISELEKYIEGKEVYKMLEIKLKELKEKE